MTIITYFNSPQFLPKKKSSLGLFKILYADDPELPKRVIRLMRYTKILGVDMPVQFNEQTMVLVDLGCDADCRKYWTYVEDRSMIPSLFRDMLKTYLTGQGHPDDYGVSTVRDRITPVIWEAQRTSKSVRARAFFRLMTGLRTVPKDDLHVNVSDFHFRITTNCLCTFIDQFHVSDV